MGSRAPNGQPTDSSNDSPNDSSAAALPAGSSVDIYDAVSHTFLVRNAPASPVVQVGPDQAVVAVLVRSGGAVTYEGRSMRVNGVIVDFAGTGSPADRPPRLKGLGSARSIVGRGGETPLYATVEDPVGTPVHRGADEIGAFFDSSRSLADSIELRSLDVTMVCGNEAAFAMQVRPVIGGATYAMEAIDVMSFADDGRITSMRAYWQPERLRHAAFNLT